MGHTKNQWTLVLSKLDDLREFFERDGDVGDVVIVSTVDDATVAIEARGTSPESMVVGPDILESSWKACHELAGSAQLAATDVMLVDLGNFASGYLTVATGPRKGEAA